MVFLEVFPGDFLQPPDHLLWDPGFRHPVTQRCQGQRRDKNWKELLGLGRSEGPLRTGRAGADVMKI
jgi:hypothetical protein